MARVEAVVVCLLIIAMDVVAGVLGIHAERAQHQGRRLRILFIECRQPVRQAIVVVVGLALLILGALPNAKRKAAECGLPRHRFLSIGGVLCFVHALFCLVYYVSANAAKREEAR
uniref:Uncharacterized protein n=1 Tax=Oryza brachyantha TaxID=4533 RepID=J3MLS8_ORYBR